MVDEGISWALSLPLRLLLSFIYRFVPCKMQKLPRKQKALLPPPSPPEVFANPISCLLCAPARGCWHYLFLSLHSVMVSTGGGDSPLLIRAGPCLLLVGHLSRGGGGVGLALLELRALLLRQALKKLLVLQPGAGVADGDMGWTR